MIHRIDRSMLRACMLSVVLFVAAGLARGAEASGTTAAVPSTAPDRPSSPPARWYPESGPPGSFEKAALEMGLGPEVSLALKDLVGARNAARWEVGEQINRHEFTSYEEIQRAYAAANAKVDAKVRALLTPPQYARYEFACEEALYRDNVLGFCICLSTDGLMLTDPALEKLVAWTMTFYRQWGVNPHLDATYFLRTERALDQYVQARERADLEIRRRAAEILPPEAMRVLERSQSEQIKGAKEVWHRTYPTTPSPK